MCPPCPPMASTSLSHHSQTCCYNYSQIIPGEGPIWCPWRRDIGRFFLLGLNIICKEVEYKLLHSLKMTLAELKQSRNKAQHKLGMLPALKIKLECELQV